MGGEGVTERDAALVMLAADGVGPTVAERLRDLFGSYGAAVLAIATSGMGVERVPPRVVESVRRVLADGAWVRELEFARAAGARFVVRGGPEYPAALGEIPGAPVGVFVMGAAPAALVPMVAVVGTRTPTARGAAFARELSGDLVRCGLTVVSGLARGVDTAAHRGAVEGGGSTVAVLGSGLERVYPPENRGLAKRILERGALLSEFPMRTDPMPGFFPCRNRIISGLSAGVVVVEAAERSGALITAARALEQGRDVFAVPGPVGDPMSAGPNGLIKAGAKLVEGVADVLEELEAAWGPFGVPPGQARRPTVGAPAAGQARPRGTGGDAHALPVRERVAQRLGLTPVSVDELAAASGASVAEVLSSLLELELLGEAARLPGGRFMLGTRAARRRQGASGE